MNWQPPNWRPLTILILIAQVPFLIWFTWAFFSSASSNADCTGQYQEMCRAGTAIGATFALAMILVIWASVDVILGTIWVVTNSEEVSRRKMKRCPKCVESVLAEATVCKHCGHHFPTRNLRCYKCKHLQEVPTEGSDEFVCEECGVLLKRIPKESKAT